MRASRAPFLSASLVPALLGAFAAYWRTGRLNAAGLLATLAGIACVHLGANLANDYFDYKTGCDSRNPEPTPYSGGSRVIQDGLISGRAVVTASAFFFAAGAVLGLYLNSLVPGNGILIIGLIGIAGGLFYTAVPVRLSYRGLGEITVFLCFGPLLVAGSYLVQSGRLDSDVFAVSLPAGLLVLAILLVNEVLDVRWDREAGKNTLVVALGRERGYAAFLITYIAAYAWIGVGICIRLYPLAAVISMLPLVLSIRALLPRRALRDRRDALNASRLTILSQAGTVLLLALSHVI